MLPRRAAEVDFVPQNPRLRVGAERFRRREPEVRGGRPEPVGAQDAERLRYDGRVLVRLQPDRVIAVGVRLVAVAARRRPDMRAALRPARFALKPLLFVVVQLVLSDAKEDVERELDCRSVGLS
jgi:hypothetical protein